MLKEKLQKYDVILASQSPRRQQLLSELQFSFRIEVNPVDEVYSSKLIEHEITNYLAKLKAEPFQNQLRENALVITSDTIVWHKNKALGKPEDENDAFNMLKGLSNSTHKVFSSVCYTTLCKQLVDWDCTEVTFKELTDEEIWYYIKTFKPFDKAGAYGIQDWIGQIGITKMNGSYFNVMGLPIHLVYKTLNENF
ncbi:MAG: Maf family nucleotide pyrophosphatase [bacterium]